MSEKFLATINVPGYLPTEDDPPMFDTAREAWEYLVSERNHEMEGIFEDDPATFDFMRQDMDAVGSINANTPGYEGDHDLGLSYTVTRIEVEDED